jgi:hypothetical protein
MFRSLAAVAVLFVVVGCGPADQASAGRCTADAQCPVGASCDTKLGVCVTGTAQSSTKPLPANYGKYCENDSHCAGIAGTTCNYNECTYSCANGATCPAGTTCGGSSFPGCFQDCAQSSECKNDSVCGVMKPSNGAAFSACAPRYPSDLGGPCEDDLGCGEDFKCVVTTSRPNGYCTKSCTANSDCWGGLCVVVGSNTSGVCAPKCDSPGTMSTCAPASVCRPLNSASYGYCF